MLTSSILDEIGNTMRTSAPSARIETHGRSSRAAALAILTAAIFGPVGAGARTFEDRYGRVIEAELSRVLGVRLKVAIRDYDYSSFGVTERDREPSFIKDWYARAADFRETTADNPMTSRTALLISNSFGAFAVRHLAPA